MNLRTCWKKCSVWIVIILLLQCFNACSNSENTIPEWHEKIKRYFDDLEITHNLTYTDFTKSYFEIPKINENYSVIEINDVAKKEHWLLKKLQYEFLDNIGYYVFAKYNEKIFSSDGRICSDTGIVIIDKTLGAGKPATLDVTEDNKDDIKVEMILGGRVKNYSVKLPQSIVVELDGGLTLNIIALTNLTNPIEIYTVKALIYKNKNYRYIIGFTFSKLPTAYTFFASSENIYCEFNFLPQSVNYDVESPYKIIWNSTESIEKFELFAGILNITHNKEMYGVIRMYNTPPKYASLYYNENSDIIFQLESSSACNIDIEFHESELTMNASIYPLPSHINISLSDGNICYNGSQIISLLKLETIYRSQNKSLCAEIKNISNFTLAGNFKIPEVKVEKPQNVGPIDRIINYVIARIYAPIERAKRTILYINELLFTGTAEVKFQSQTYVDIDLVVATDKYLQYKLPKTHTVTFIDKSFCARIFGIKKIHIFIQKNDFLLDSFSILPLKILVKTPTKLAFVNITNLPKYIKMYNGNFETSETINVQLIIENMLYTKISGLTNFEFKNYKFSFTKPVEIEFYKGICVPKNCLFINFTNYDFGVKLENITKLELSEKFLLRTTQNTLFVNLVGGDLFGDVGEEVFFIKNLPELIYFNMPENINIPEIRISNITHTLENISFELNNLTKKINICWSGRNDVEIFGSNASLILPKSLELNFVNTSQNINFTVIGNYKKAPENLIINHTQIFMYVKKLPMNFSLTANINLTKRLCEIYYISDESLETMYICTNLIKIVQKLKLGFSNIPKTLQLFANFEKLELQYDANEKINYLFLSCFKDQNDIDLRIENLPEELILTTSYKQKNPKKLLLSNIIPSIKFTANSKLNLYWAGKMIGFDGDFCTNLYNFSNIDLCVVENKLEVKHNAKVIHLSVRNLRYSKEILIKSIFVVISGNVKLNLYLLFGKIPIIVIDCEKITVDIYAEITMLGMRKSNFVFWNLFKFTTTTNTLNIDKNTKYIVPAPMLTLWKN